MDPKIRDWITKQQEELPPDQKAAFLRVLKFDPARALRIISANMLGWSTQAAFEVGGFCDMTSFDDAPALLLAHWQKHFAPDLAQIQQ